MKNIKYIVGMLMMVVAIAAQAQSHGVQVAPRAGIMMWMPTQSSTGQTVTSKMGFQGGLDLSYLLRWRVGDETQLGLRTGLGLTYSMPGKLGTSTQDSYTNTDYLGQQIDYTTTATIEEQHRQLEASLPIMASLQTHGFTLNLGPKLLYLNDNYTQTVTDAHIDAYYPAYKVHFYDQNMTGRIPCPATYQGQGGLSPIHVLVSGELGYEWNLSEAHSLYGEHYVGIQLYADYSVWSLPQDKVPTIGVAPILRPNTTPDIRLGAIAQTTDPMRYLSAGIRLYYTFQVTDYGHNGWHATSQRGRVADDRLKAKRR